MTATDVSQASGLCRAPGLASGKDRGEKRPARAARPLAEVLPALAGCVSIRGSVNQTSVPREAGLSEVSFHGATLPAPPFARWPSGGLGWGTNLECLSSDRNGPSEISQGLNKVFVTSPLSRNPRRTGDVADVGSGPRGDASSQADWMLGASPLLGLSSLNCHRGRRADGGARAERTWQA